MLRRGLTPRVLMTADSVGGVFQHAIELSAGLIARGYEVVLAMLGPEMTTRQREDARAVPRVVETRLPLEWLAPDAASLRDAAHRLAAIAEAEGADLIHLNTQGLALPAGTAPVIQHAHSCLATWWSAVRGGTRPHDFEWRVEAVTTTLARADEVVCPSRDFAARTADMHGRAARTIHNGRTVHGAAARGLAPFALTLGRFWDEGKNFATLDAASAVMRTTLLAAGPLSGPALPGSAPAQVACRHAVSLGPVSEHDTRRLLGLRPVFVSASVYETFGLAALEAAQAGCALILADIPTYRELWEDAAMFVPARDSAAFADAIDLVSSRPALRTELGARAQERAALYSVERMTNATIALYAQLGVAAP